MLTQLIHHWLVTAGYAGVFAIIFAGPGLFIGFILPGDSVLFTAGLLASQHVFSLPTLLSGVVVAAFIGYQVGYWFGVKLGGWLMKRPDTWYFKKRYIEEAHVFYQKHGGKALLIARLIPVVRTFVPIVAGMARMNMRPYLVYNFLGSLIWAGGVTLLGYWLGEKIPHAEHYILPIVMTVVVISILPGLWHLVKKRAT